LLYLISENDKIEKHIIVEIKNFYNEFFAQNYSNILDVIKILKKLSKKNTFAEYLLNISFNEWDESFNKNKFIEELDRISNILNGVFFSKNITTKNIESLRRIRMRIFTILASQYSQKIPLGLEKIGFPLSIKDNAKELFLDNIIKNNIRHINDYIDINDLIKSIQRINLYKTLFSNILVFAEINEQVILKIKNSFSQGNLILKETIDDYVNSINLFTIDINSEDNKDNLIQNIMDNSGLLRIIEKFIDKQIYMKSSFILLRIIERFIYKCVNREINIIEKKEIQNIIVRYILSDCNIKQEEWSKLKKILCKNNIKKKIDKFVIDNQSLFLFLLQFYIIFSNNLNLMIFIWFLLVRHVKILNC